MAFSGSSFNSFTMEPEVIVYLFISLSLLLFYLVLKQQSAERNDNLRAHEPRISLSCK